MMRPTNVEVLPNGNRRVWADAPRSTYGTKDPGEWLLSRDVLNPRRTAS